MQPLFVPFRSNLVIAEIELVTILSIPEFSAPEPEYTSEFGEPRCNPCAAAAQAGCGDSGLRH